MSLRYAHLGAFLLPLLALAGCGDGDSTHPGLDEIEARGSLKVLTRNAPTSFYIDRLDRPAGPEYALTRAFANSLGLDTEYIVKDSVQALLEALDRGEGDLVAAGITRTQARSNRYRFSPGYQQVTQQVVCSRSGPIAKKPAELAEVELAVIAKSSYAERLRKMQVQRPQLSWRSVADVGTEQLLEQVWRGDLDCTVADSNIVAINRRYFPELVVGFDLTRPQDLAWVFPPSTRRLQREARAWLRQFRRRGHLAAVMERYYGFIEIFDYVDTRAFIRRSKRILPKYQRLFRQAGRKHDLPPLLLAAQAYQESHWDPRAKSPTGVRGMMMLTRITAKELGIHNRLDARQSILGGARYLAKLRSRLDEAIREPDRTWLALAAYNVGMGHLHDAQTLARQLGEDPYRWSGLREVLPLLAEERYYRELKYGYARGLEPVRYVQRIRDYRNILERLFRGR